MFLTKLKKVLSKKTCAGVVFLIKLQAKTNHKICKKIPALGSHFQERCKLEAQYQHQIVDTLEFFHGAAYN